MPITYFPLNVDVSQVVGKPVRRALLEVRTNLPDGTVLAYGESGQIAVPGGVYNLASGIGSLTLPTKTGLTNVGDYQYVITGVYHLDGVDPVKMDPIYIDAPTSTAAVNLADFIGVTSVPATFMGQAVAQLQAKVDEAEAIKQYVNDVSNIDTTVSAVDFALGQPGPAATLNAAMGDQISTPGTPAEAATSALIGTEVAPVAADLARTKGETIRPSEFAGATDRAKLQATITACIAGGYKTIVLDRWYDLTGGAPIKVNKVNWYDRDKILITADGGGIIKNDAGACFTSDTVNTGDLAFSGVKFRSVAGAGAVLIDAEKLIRWKVVDCTFSHWDHLATQTATGRLIQSARILDNDVIGGAGAFVRCRESYDVTLRDNLVEDRIAKGEQAMFFENTDATMSVIANRSLRILNNVVENTARVPIKLAMTWGGALDLNYFEANGNPTDPQIDLWTLAQSARQTGVRLSNNMVSQKSSQIAAHVGAILIGANAGDEHVTSIGNVTAGGILFEFGGAPSPSGRVFSSGDRVEGSGLLVYPGQERRIFTPGGKSTTTALRPKNPRTGLDTYFDTDLNKLITPKTVGTTGVCTVRFTAGATSSGNITITLLGTSYTVAVTAGDTINQVRDKVVAAAGSFFPKWKPRLASTASVAFDALTNGPLSGSVVFSGGTTGVAADYSAIDVVGTNPVWVDAMGTVV